LLERNAEIKVGDLTVETAGPGALVGELALMKDQAINYAEGSASFRSGEIRILDSSGHLECTIAFNEADRKL